MIALILMGASFLSLSMGFTGLPRELAAWIAEMGLSPIALIAAVTILYIVIGMFLDGISSVVLTMAIVEPMIRQVGIDVIWFGISHRRGRRDGTDHRANWIQPVRHARHHQLREMPGVSQYRVSKRLIFYRVHWHTVMVSEAAMSPSDPQLHNAL